MGTGGDPLLGPAEQAEGSAAGSQLIPSKLCLFIKALVDRIRGIEEADHARRWTERLRGM